VACLAFLDSAGLAEVTSDGDEDDWAAGVLLAQSTGPCGRLKASEESEVKTACVFALLLASSAAVAGEPNIGRLIGDGITGPREIVAGRSGLARLEEVRRWFKSSDKAETMRLCEIKTEPCVDIISIPLVEDGHTTLSLMYVDRGKKTRPDADYRNAGEYFMLCYSFTDSVYRARIRDGYGTPWRFPGKGFRGPPEPLDHPVGLAM
jgi:hypothetical protein